MTTIHSNTFAIPQMTNVVVKNDMTEPTEDQKEQNEIDGMGFEAMKGEASYQSPSEANEEALRKIKAMKISGFVLLGSRKKQSIA